MYNIIYLSLHIIYSIYAYILYRYARGKNICVYTRVCKRFTFSGAIIRVIAAGRGDEEEEEDRARKGEYAAAAKERKNNICKTTF